MKILIDGQSLQTDSRDRGIGRYTEGLINGLCRNGAEVIVLFNGSYEPRCTEAIQRIAQSVPTAKVERFFAVGNCNSLNINGLDYFLSSHLYQEAVDRIAPDVFLCSSVLESQQTFICPPLERIAKQYPVVAVNYDMIPLENVENYLPNKEIRDWYFSSLRSMFSVDLALCISRFSEQQLQNVCPNIATKVIWGASFTEKVEQIQKKNYLFYCGGLDNRKNVDFLCRAYAALPYNLRSEHPLYICCRKNTHPAQELKKLIDRLHMGRYIQLVEAENNGELARLYAECQLFVFPSKCEGLGLPLIEALTYQAPVLSSQATSLPEIIDNSEAWFSPYDESQLTEKLRQALTQPNMLKRLQMYSNKNQNKFTWEKTGLITLSALSQLVEKKRSQQHSIVDLSFVALPETMSRNFKLSRARQCKRTIYFDISEYYRTTAHTGIQRVVQKFLQYLPQELNEYNFDIVYISGSIEGPYRVIEFRNREWHHLEPVQPVAGDWYMSVDLCSWQILNHQSDLIEWKHQGVKLFFYVYDIIFYDYPKFVVDYSTVDILNRWLKFVAINADCIMTDSNTVADNLKRWACENDVNVSKTIFLPQHLGTDFKLKHVQNSRKSPVFQFICVSTIEPRKGYLPLLNAFIKALDEGLNARLIIVGRPGWKADDEIELLKTNSYVDKNIFWEDNCSDDRLRELYSQSHCFIFASYDEGFGLGIVEAAQSGLPLLLRDIPVFREIAGDHALYFTDENLTDYLKLVVSGKKKLPSIHGMKILTWKQSVHESASQFVSLAKNEFFSYMKDPIKKVSSETITELIFEDTQENPPPPQYTSHCENQPRDRSVNCASSSRELRMRSKTCDKTVFTTQSTEISNLVTPLSICSETSTLSRQAQWGSYAHRIHSLTFTSQTHHLCLWFLLCTYRSETQTICTQIETSNLVYCFDERNLQTECSKSFEHSVCRFC